MPRNIDGAPVHINDSFIPSSPGNTVATNLPPSPAEEVALHTIGAAAPGALAVPLCLILLGPPGSGKTTQGNILGRSLQIPSISVGKLLRDEVAKQTPLGKKLAPYLERGELAPNTMVMEVLKTRLQQPDTKQGFIIDGFPRNLQQIPEFERFINRSPHELRVIGLELSDDKARERLLQRGRQDDSIEVINHRLQQYHERTQPVIDYFSRAGLYHPIDASGSITQVADCISQEISGWYPRDGKSDNELISE